MGILTLSFFKMTSETTHPKNHYFAFLFLFISFLGLGYFLAVYPKVFRVEAKTDNEKTIKPLERLVVRFSRPMMTDQANSFVTVFPSEDINITWNDSRTMVVTPKTFWKPGCSYNLSIKKGKSAYFTQSNASFLFDIEDYPKIIDVYPPKGEKDVLLDIEDPIIFKFDKSVKEYKTDFSINPSQAVAFETSEDGAEVKLLPESELKRGELYKLDAYIRYKEEDDSNLKKIFSTDFETKPLPPADWEKNFDQRIEQAKKYTEPKILAGKYIDLNLKGQMMTTFENGKLLDAYLISTGKKSMPTPEGSFKICNKYPRAWSKKYGLFMPFWMALVPSGDFGIHELPEWPGGYKEGAAHLGTPVSHGCVRLGIGPAKIVYDWAEIGTPVVIHE